MIVHSALSAGTYLAGKRALAELSPVDVAIARFALAALVHAGVLWRLRVRFERRDLPGIAALGGLPVPVNQLLFLGGLALSTPGHAALFYAMTPIFVFLVERLRGRERGSPRKVTGIAVAFAGTVVVLSARGVLGVAGARDVLVGDLLLLGAVVTWSLYAVGGKAYAARYGGLAAAAGRHPHPEAESALRVRRRGSAGDCRGGGGRFEKDRARPALHERPSRAG